MLSSIQWWVLLAIAGGFLLVDVHREFRPYLDSRAAIGAKAPPVKGR